MRLYVVHGVGGGDSGLVEQEGTRLMLGGRHEDILPEDNIPRVSLRERGIFFPRNIHSCAPFELA